MLLVAAAAKNVYMRGFKGVFRRGNTIFACGLRFCSQFSFRLNRARPPPVRLAFHFVQIAHGSGLQSLTQAKQFVNIYKWGKIFFKQKTVYSRRQRGRNTVGTRAEARRYPTERATTNKRFLERKMVPSIGIEPMTFPMSRVQMMF